MAVTRMSQSSIGDFAKANAMSGPRPSNFGQVVVVAGGGSGGGRIGGGGGAGGLITGTFFAKYGFTVTVGAGGASVATSITGNVGSDSMFGSLTADGGGGGGGFNNSATDGGSGGGTSGYSASAKGLATQSPGFGHDGGERTTNYGSAGGGGAGEAGTSRGASNGGHGGDGLSAAVIVGTSYGENGWFAGGGGGGEYTGSPGNGGIGGGGDGGGGAGDAGTVNTGGGGGGSEGSGEATGAGGSGIVLIRVPSTVVPTFSAGVTQSSSTFEGDTIYAITATSTTSETVTFG